jgi:beta-mannosidase
MVYHDMAYASDAGKTHGPIATPTQHAELRHQIRRLSHHPAIVLWDGNNEVPVNMWQPSGVFASFVMTVVAQEDQSRAVWPSSPSRGWATGVHRLYQTPDWDSPQGLFTQGGGHSWTGGIESHAPYQTGGADGFPTVNGGAADTCFIQNGMGNGVNLPSVFTPPQGVGPPPVPHNVPCYTAVKTICSSHLKNLSDCENCRFSVTGAWDKLKAACGPTPIATFHESCHSFFPTPPVVAHTGIGQANIYASEFGTTGSSSFESMAPTLSPKHWGLHGGMEADACDKDQKPNNFTCVGEHLCTGENPMAQRNYACDGAIRLFFGNRTTVDIAATGESSFKGQLYQCQLVQAVVLKQIYEARRAQNAFGHLVWMLNEIWPTVGWGSLEYGPPPGFTAGQVRGGRWKPLHYFYKNSLMRDVMATCGKHSRPSANGTASWACYVSNHGAGVTFSGTVTLTAYDHFGTGSGVVVASKQMEMSAGPGAIEWFDADLPAGNTSSVISTVRDSKGELMSEHMVQLVKPMEMRVPVAKLSFKVANGAFRKRRGVYDYDYFPFIHLGCQDRLGTNVRKPEQTRAFFLVAWLAAANADGTIDIAVSSDKVALWVTLTTLAQGRFSDNAFLLPATTKTIQFVPNSPSPSTSAAEDMRVLKESLRIEDFSMYRPLVD